VGVIQSNYSTRTALKSSRNGEMKKTTTGKDRSACARRVNKQLITCEECKVIRDAARSSDELLMNSLNRLLYGAAPA
jgi:hypothetical protein